jgi:hypothetical protein
MSIAMLVVAIALGAFVKTASEGHSVQPMEQRFVAMCQMLAVVAMD